MLDSGRVPTIALRFNIKINLKRFVSEVGSTRESGGDRRCFEYAQVVRKHVRRGAIAHRYSCTQVVLLGFIGVGDR